VCRKVVVVLVVAALLGAVVAPAAIALSERCGTLPCKGTNHKDRLGERKGNGVADRIYGLGGKDTLRADRYGNDRDSVYGGDGDDFINTADGDSKDKIDAGGGFDTCYLDIGEANKIKGCDSTQETD
jgi:hypothetical protein